MNPFNPYDFNSSDVLTSACFVKGDDIESIRPEESKSKGYSIRAYNPNGAGPLKDVVQAYNENHFAGNPLPARDVVQNEGAMPGYLFDGAYKKVLNLAFEYDKFPRNNTKLREEKIAQLAKMETVANNYLEQYPLPAAPSEPEIKRYNMVIKILNGIAVEKRFLFGITESYGKIYLPEDEQDVRENFARGNSASIAKVTYKGEKSGDDPFVAVFKASTTDQIVNAEAAKAFSITDHSGNNTNSETARLTHRSVYFYELDLLMGMGLTPPTFYAIHNGQPGSCQQFIEGQHISERGSVDLPYDAKHIDTLHDIVHGELLDQGRSFRLQANSPALESQLATMSNEELKVLYDAENLVLTREQVNDIPPLDLRHPKTQKALADAQLLDHLAGSVDRNLSNIFFVPKVDEDGKAYYGIQLIDNDLCAAAANVHENEQAHSLTNPFRINMAGRVPNFIDRSTAMRLQNMSFEEVYELLKLHQLVDDTELVSQRERLRHCIDAISRALNSFSGKAQVVYQTSVKEPKRDEATGEEIPGEFEEGKSTETISLVNEWDEETYQNMLKNEDTYLFKANNCRIAELSTIMESNPEKAAEIWATQFSLMGARPMAEAYGKDRRAIAKLQNVLTHYRKKIILKNHSDIKQACDFVHTLVKHPRQKLTLDEQQEKFDLLLPMMLGDKVSGQHIGKALNWCLKSKLLSASTVMALLPQATKMAEDSPVAQWKPSETFMSEFKFMNQEGGFPPVPARIALSQCVDGATPKRESIAMLRFCSLLTNCTVPEYRKNNKKLDMDIMNCDEFKHAMNFITPATLKRLLGSPASKCRTVIEDVCFQNKEELNQKNIEAVINLLKYHFGVVEHDNL